MTVHQKYAYWIHSGFYSSLQKLSVLIFGIGSTMLLTRWLDKHEMGVWSLFLAIAAFIEIIRHGLVKNAVIKYLNSSAADDKKFIYASALMLNILITVFIGIVLLLLMNTLVELLKAYELKKILYIFGIGLFFLIPFSHFEWIQNSHGAFKGIFWAWFWRQLVTLLLIVITQFFYHDITLELLALYYSVGIFVGTLISYRFVHSYLTGTFIVTRTWLLRLWHFGKYVFGSNFSATIFRITDLFFVSHFLYPPIVALQSISARITNVTDIPSQVIGDILFPKSAQSDTAGDSSRIKFLYEKSVGGVLAFVIPATLFVIIFPKFILLIIAGKDYIDAAPYLQLIVLAGIFLPFLKQFGTIMDSTAKPKINFLVISVIALVNILLCYLLIQRYDLMGAGYALLLTHLIGFMITQNILNKYYQINFLNCFKYAAGFYPEMLDLFYQKALKWHRS